MRVVKMTERNQNERGMPFDAAVSFVGNMRMVERWVRRLAPTVEFVVHDAGADQLYLNVRYRKDVRTEKARADMVKDLHDAGMDAIELAEYTDSTLVEIHRSWKETHSK